MPYFPTQTSSPACEDEIEGFQEFLDEVFKRFFPAVLGEYTSNNLYFIEKFILMCQFQPNIMRISNLFARV